MIPFPMKAFDLHARQRSRNEALLAASPSLGRRVASRVPPFRLDLSRPLSDADATLLEALQISAARLAVSSVASLAQINEVDHLGGGLDLIPALLATLSQTDGKAVDFTIENAHTSAGYYSVLATLGYLAPERVVSAFRRSLDIPGHVSWVPGGTPCNGGRLGVMIPVAAGAALAKKAKYGENAWMICHCGDAGWISGQALGGFHAADLLSAPVTFVMHRNGVQLSGAVSDVTVTDPRTVVSALGVEILEIPFLHDARRLWDALGEARALARNGRPSLIYPTGEADVPLAEVGERLGIAPELASFAAANGVDLATRVWMPGCLMSYRDTEAMLQCLFFVNALPGGKPHHDGHMKGRDAEAVLAGPMLRLSPAHEAALAAGKAQEPVELVTEARPAKGSANLALDDEAVRAADAALPKPGPKLAAVRAGSSAGYELVAKTHPEATFVLDCDIAPSTKLAAAMDALDGRHKFQLSIEEQVAALMANGIAESGNDPKLVVFSTFAAFFEGIAREGFEMWRYQRNLTGANEGLNVTFHLSHVGSCTGRDHFSGWSLDWINLAIGVLPYLDRFYAPADPHAALQAVRDLAARSGGHIIGIPRESLPVLANPAAPEKPLYDAAAPWRAVTPLVADLSSEKAILGFGATACVAKEAAEAAGVAAYAVNGLPLAPEDIASLAARHPGGIVTMEDGLIGTEESGLRGFAALARSVLPKEIPLAHLGITDPTVAPSEGHLALWDYFGLTKDCALEALASL